MNFAATSDAQSTCMFARACACVRFDVHERDISKVDNSVY